MEQGWKCFLCSRALLNLDIVLNCGQCFRWSKNEGDEWIGVIGERIWILKQDAEQLYYKIIGAACDHAEITSVENITLPDDKPALSKSRRGRASAPTGNLAPLVDGLKNNDEEILTDYFQLNVDLEGLYDVWSKNDQIFNKLSQNFGGIRMLRQDPVENLFSFICSQNNHISRIATMVGRLCSNYGRFINNVGGISYYEFPTVSALSNDAVDGDLRRLGFGYRAKFINQCAKLMLNRGGRDWLSNLRNTPYKEAHSALCELPGVGAKVADCVCLMSLDKAEAIPVDTHMWQIAQRDYLPHLKKYKSLTDKIYQEIGDHFREIYGNYAGWAHSVLFSADLQRFRKLKEDALQPNRGKDAKEVKKKKAETIDETNGLSLGVGKKAKGLKRQSNQKDTTESRVKKRKVR